MERHTILQAREWLVKILSVRQSMLPSMCSVIVSGKKWPRRNPLRKQYYEKRDDSDKLKLDTVDED